ncbi:MAG: Spy/CpxP family protein refolding chaperone [Alphaproteobacteria bacterium]|nr:Spy/CpxP family protein refolding chaperone [Alphaproteobacteria bacterium]MBV9198393.1 Spy/CpxP family protein refolding chaperone [Alphaproteobacteria bacterium]MBV9373461.1 Spy/CpxP family protein refolding chaperone [Alphaproteobacteria bacterium]
MKILSDHLASVAIAALLTLPGAALAQSAQPPATHVTTPPPPANTTSPMAGHPVAGKNAEERVENRIKELHAQLRITPAEEPQWNQFAEVMRENAREMDQTLMQRGQQFSTMSAVQNLQSYAQVAEAHAQRVQKLVPAFENLYNAMPEQQKQVADQVFRGNAEKHIGAAQSHRGRTG